MTAGNKNILAMLSTQPAEIAVNDAPPSLENIEGASFRFSLAPERAEMRYPERKDIESVATEEQNEAREKTDQARLRHVVDHQKALVKLIHRFSGRHHYWQVFSDFCEMAAISFSNAVDVAHSEKREERYMQIVKGYNREEIETLSRGIAHVTMALEDGFSDVLGRTYHDLELHNKWSGQFFTPYGLSRAIARITIGDREDLKERIAERGFVTAQEPAVGSGSMIIALAEEMLDAGINYQEHLHVTAIDVDQKCAHMAYLQFSLLHIPAVIVHGNTLSLEEWSHWYTPAHILGGWKWKLRRRSSVERALQILTAPEPEAAPVELRPEQESDGPRGQLKLF